VYNWGTMTTTMIRTNIFLTPAQRETLAKRSADTGAPVGAIIRMAIDKYLGTSKPPKRRKRED
jgi:hypothetical protein